MSNGITRRFWNFLIAQDMAINSLLGGRARETLSGSAGRALDNHEKWASFAVAFIDAIFGKGHCAREAIREELHRRVEHNPGLE